MPERVTLDALNAASAEEFAAALAGIFQDAPWVAEEAASSRPFATVAALHDALMAVIAARGPDRQVAFIGGFPDLAGKAQQDGTMGAASEAEHAGLGLDRLSAEEFATWGRLNAAYRTRFGFPFMMCVRRQTRDAVLDAFERRLGNDRVTELAAAIAEIGHVSRLRLVDAVAGPGAPPVAGALTTHVLDTYHGRAAEGVRIELHEVGRSARALLATTVTNAAGRTDSPLLGGAPLRVGTYELSFHIGAYFAASGIALPVRPFLDVVPLRFGISEPEGHYHVPLVATPWSFSTYRGG